jgi:hypothetical protein
MFEAFASYGFLTTMAVGGVIAFGFGLFALAVR